MDNRGIGEGRIIASGLIDNRTNGRGCFNGGIRCKGPVYGV